MFKRILVAVEQRPEPALVGHARELAGLRHQQPRGPVDLRGPFQRLREARVMTAADGIKPHQVAC